MDHFGIGIALEAIMETFFRAARRTGRTTSLVDSVKNGDRVVFLTYEQGRRCKQLCKERDIEIEIVVNNPRDAGQLFETAPPYKDGRVIFDHMWVEEYYKYTLNGAQKSLDRLQTELSGRGEVHRKLARDVSEFAERSAARWVR